MNKCFSMSMICSYPSCHFDDPWQKVLHRVNRKVKTRVVALLGSKRQKISRLSGTLLRRDFVVSKLLVHLSNPRKKRFYPMALTVHFMTTFPVFYLTFLIAIMKGLATSTSFELLYLLTRLTTGSTNGFPWVSSSIQKNLPQNQIFRKLSSFG